MSENPPKPTSSRSGNPNMFMRSRDISLRVRLIFIILLITTLSVLALGIFSYFRAQQAQTFLHDQLQTNVIQGAEAQLSNQTLTAANQADQYFQSIIGDLRAQSIYFENIQNRLDVFGTGTYWNGSQKLSPLPGGQWDNPNSDPAAVMVPSNVVLDMEEVAEINSFMYLDFSAPEMLKMNSSMSATYFIDTDGVMVHYPNNDLAHIIGNVNATTRPEFQIATPDNNPERLPVWTAPYQNSTNSELIVTHSIPVYNKNDKFLGVLCADIRLSALVDQIKNIQVGSTGYAFLIDPKGLIVAMPDKGYNDFKITASALSANDPVKQSMLGQGSGALKSITQKMVAGEKGVVLVTINRKDRYIAYAPLPSPGYSLGLIIPTAELNAPFIKANAELDNQTINTLNFSLLIIVVILLFTVLISWFIGNQLTDPLIALTKTTQKIIAGDFTVKARADSNDEIGTLGKAFNSMTSLLRDSITNLEARVNERTNQITIANETNSELAQQLRAVSEIARSVASLKNLDVLLPEIAQQISSAFGFQHIGIYLLDDNREYALLKATNSAGGHRMLAGSEHITVGDAGIVAFVTQTGLSRTAQNAGQDARYFNNPDLPDSQSEMTLPLKIGEEIIGALDVQRTEPAAFTDQDLDTFGLLAAQIAIAIQNANLFEETRTALQEAQNIYAQTAQESWRDINRQSRVSGFRYLNGSVEALPPQSARATGTSPLDPSALIAASPNQVKISSDFETVSIPIVFRNQSLGSLKIRQPGRTQAWRDSEIRLYQSIVERLSFALENARLYLDAQKRASKERVIGEIGAKINSSVNMDNILQIVVEELGRSMPGSEVYVQFEKGDPAITLGGVE